MRKVKKRRISIRKTTTLLLPLILIVVLLFNYSKIVTFCQSKITGYSVNTINVFHELDIYDDVKRHEYSNTLEEAAGSKYFNTKYCTNFAAVKQYKSDNKHEIILYFKESRAAVFRCFGGSYADEGRYRSGLC